MKKCLVTGGMGFIGFNSCLHYARQGFSVIAFDNLSRETAHKNYQAFRKTRPPSIRFVRGDVRRSDDLRRVFQRYGRFDCVFHMAAQTAVTTSVVEPRTDFEANAWGTFNVLEAVRRHCPKAAFIFASTNKVYGEMNWMRFKRRGNRYHLRYPADGVDESAALDFHSPYGCSKGAADQYVRDYARIYGMNTAVFRQSCIYGPWQYGQEDQGWIAWFLIAALADKRITIYGDGKQVRDALFINDLLSLYDAALRRMPKIRGETFNVGGGPERTLSLLELLEWIRRRLHIQTRLERAGWRPGDQKVYVSNVAKARRLLDWSPAVSVRQGLEKLLVWLEPVVSGQ